MSKKVKSKKVDPRIAKAQDKVWSAIAALNPNDDTIFKVFIEQKDGCHILLDFKNSVESCFQALVDLELSGARWRLIYQDLECLGFEKPKRAKSKRAKTKRAKTKRKTK